MTDSERPFARPPGASVLEDLAQRLRALAEAGPARDLQRNLNAMLASALQRMDLVTREEFDVQSALLARTRERLEALQARVDALERAAGPGGESGAAAAGGPDAR
jgi:BMFP domain-containing protein YqiC